VKEGASDPPLTNGWRCVHQTLIKPCEGNRRIRIEGSVAFDKRRCRRAFL